MADVTAIIAKLQSATTLSDLGKGVTGDAVKALQDVLNTLGAGIGVDGVYGDKTSSAVNALRGMLGIGDGAFDKMLRASLATDLLAGPNATTVLKALAATGGVALPQQTAKVQLSDLAGAVDQLLQAGLTGTPPSMLAAQVALAFLNYYPAGMVGRTDDQANTVFAQALLAFARVAFSDAGISSTSNVNQSDLYSRLGQSLQSAIVARGVQLPGADGDSTSTLKDFLTHPFTVISAGSLLLWWGAGRSIKRVFFGGVGDDGDDAHAFDDGLEDIAALSGNDEYEMLAGLASYEVRPHGRRRAAKARRATRGKGRAAARAR